MSARRERRRRIARGCAGLAVVLSAAAAALPAESLAQGCAMCATYTAGDSARAHAFNTSILFLMAMPFVLVGSVGGWLMWMHRRQWLPRTARVLRAEQEGAS